MSKQKVLAPKDEEFKKVFTAAVIEISYCAMYPNSPICRDDPLDCDDCDEIIIEEEVIEE